MRLLFRQNRVVSSIVGDFDHKSAFEILTDPELCRAVFRCRRPQAVPPPRVVDALLADRRTTLPHDKEGDLLEYARRNRELLVLKPNRAYGGTGVMLGAATEQAEWEQALQKAVSRRRSRKFLGGAGGDTSSGA